MKTTLVLLSAAAVGVSTSFAATVEYFDHSAFTGSTTGSITVFGFDSLAEGTVMTGTELPDLTLSARRITVLNPQDFAPGLSVGGANLNSQPHGISASIYYSSSNTVAYDGLNDNFLITFAGPTFSAGLWLGNLGAFDGDNTTPTVVTFFGTNGTAIASETLQQGHVGMVGTGVDNRIFYGIQSDLPISSITVTNAASDGDGIILDDIQFVIPTPPGSTHLTIHTAVEICWGTETNRQYQVQWRSALDTNNWFNFGSPIFGDGLTNCVFDSTRGRDKRFYQVVTLP